MNRPIVSALQEMEAEALLEPTSLSPAWANSETLSPSLMMEVYQDFLFAKQRLCTHWVGGTLIWAGEMALERTQVQIPVPGWQSTTPSSGLL